MNGQSVIHDSQILAPLDNEFWYDFPVLRGQHTLDLLYPIIEGRGLIGGSFAAFCASPSTLLVLPNDIDIFAFSDKDARRIADVLSLKRPHLDGNVFNIKSVDLIPKLDVIDVQIVLPDPRWQIWPDDLLNFFDLDICRAVVINPGTVRADLNLGQPNGKILKIQDPIRTLKRCMKYHKRGIEFTDHELYKILDAWSQLLPDKRSARLADALAAQEQPDSFSLDYSFNPDDEYLGD